MALYGLFFLVNLPAQDITVMTNDETSLPGVEVYTDDFSWAAVTNQEGKVSLPNKDKERDREIQFLNFNFLGFEKLRLSIRQIRNRNYVIILRPDDQLIEEVVVLGRNEVREEEIPFQIASVDQKAISSTHAQTSADALQHHGGVFIQKSQMGGGSPVIRGFEANRVLLVVDGIRLNNAIYRNGHLQNAITVDQSMLQKMDVFFGPNSLMYGSDALGGVVHFQTVDPRMTTSGRTRGEVNAFTRYSTANKEKSAHVDFSIGGSSLAALSSFTISDYGDLLTGSKRDERFPDYGKRLFFQDLDEESRDIQVANDNPNLQVGTGYRQYDFLQKVKWVPNIYSQVLFNLQYSTSSDVPRYDNLAELVDGQLRWAEWNYGPQQRLLSALTYKHIKSTKFYDGAVVIASYQTIDEDRISRRFGRLLRTTQEEDVKVFGLTMDMTKHLGPSERSILQYGLDWQQNWVNSSVAGEDYLIGQSISGELSRYASDQNRLSSLGAFLYWKITSPNSLHHFNAGIRYSRTSYWLKYSANDPVDWPPYFIDGVSSNNSAITWSMGGSLNFNDGWHLRSMISTAFRSPNIDDLSKIRINADEITFPNLDLKPETSINVELTLGKEWENGLQLSTTGFLTGLKDAIRRSNFTTPDGMEFWISDGETLRVVANQNVDKARIMGISGNVDWNMTDYWTFKSSINLTSGEVTSDSQKGTPLAHIPPLYGQTSLHYETGDWECQAVWRYNGFKALKDFGGSSDNPELASPIGSLAWSTWNIYGRYSLTNHLDLSLGLENLFDKHYRPFASGVSSPGRNFIISLRGKF